MAPALTPQACISAGTGVGAASVNGTQPRNGIWLERANAETTSSAAQISWSDSANDSVTAPR